VSDRTTIQEQCYGTCWAATSLIEDLEREPAEAKENGIAWEMAALKCGLYRADVPHSTPEKWQAAQASAACALLDQLAGMKAQLTAHKAALEKCETIIEGIINNQPESEGGSMYYERFDGEGNYSGAEHVDPCGIYFGVLNELHEALAAIKQLTDPK